MQNGGGLPINTTPRMKKTGGIDVDTHDGYGG
jgi:hypothetical protein